MFFLVPFALNNVDKTFGKPRNTQDAEREGGYMHRRNKRIEYETEC